VKRSHSSRCRKVCGNIWRYFEWPFFFFFFLGIGVGKVRMEASNQPAKNVKRGKRPFEMRLNRSVIHYSIQGGISLRALYVVCVFERVHRLFSHALRKCRGVTEKARLEYVGRFLLKHTNCCFTCVSLTRATYHERLWTNFDKKHHCSFWTCFHRWGSRVLSPDLAASAERRTLILQQRWDACGINH